MTPGEPARRPGAGLKQPGDRAGPGGEHRLHAVAFQGCHEGSKLRVVGADEDQAFVLGSPLDREEASHRIPVPGIAAEAIDRLGRVGQDASGLDATGGQMQLVTSGQNFRGCVHAEDRYIEGTFQKQVVKAMLQPLRSDALSRIARDVGLGLLGVLIQLSIEIAIEILPLIAVDGLILSNLAPLPPSRLSIAAMPSSSILRLWLSVSSKAFAYAQATKPIERP